MVPTFHPRRLGDSQSMFSMQSLYPEKMYKELFKPRFHLSPGQLYTLRRFSNLVNNIFFLRSTQLIILPGVVSIPQGCVFQLLTSISDAQRYP